MDDAEVLRLFNEVAANAEQGTDRAALEQICDMVALRGAEGFSHLLFAYMTGSGDAVYAQMRAINRQALDRKAFVLLRALLRRELLGE